MVTIVVFASSLFIASAIILMKTIELKYGKRNVLFGFISKFDPDLKKLVLSLEFKSLQFIQVVRHILLVQTKIILKNLFHRIKEKIVNEYKTRRDVVMDHRNIANNGSVSFYLKKIAENRGNGKRGKIE